MQVYELSYLSKYRETRIGLHLSLLSVAASSLIASLSGDTSHIVFFSRSIKNFILHAGNLASRSLSNCVCFNYTMCCAVNVKCKPSLNETVSEI